MKNFIVRTITGIIFVAAIVSCFLNPIAMVVLFALVTGLTVWEFTGIVNEHVAATTLNRIICTVAGVWFFLAMFGFCWGIVNSAVFLVYLFTIMYLVISELYLKHENPINNWAYTMLSQMYIAMPLSLINVLAFMGSADGEVHYNYVLPLSVFVFLWVNDSGAYCCGSLLRRHKLFPRVSPGKSWEGSIGGAVLVVVVAYVISQLLGTSSPLTALEWMGLGLVVVIFGTWGDLVESLFKRTLGIKDSGNILPGHGGMLDRFDSSLMAFPAAAIYLYALF